MRFVAFSLLVLSETLAMLLITFFIVVLLGAVTSGNNSTESTTIMTKIMNPVVTSNSSGDMDVTVTNGTILPPMNATDQETSTSNATTNATAMKEMTTPQPTVVSEVTKLTTKGQKNGKNTTPQPRTDKNDSTGIIILIIIILVAVAFAGACYVARRRGRNYSVDFTSRPDETNIPLSAVEPEAPGETLPHNGMQTFESAEMSVKEQQEPEEKPLVQEELVAAESDKSVVDPSAESAAPPPDSTEQDQKADVAEQWESPPAPVETNMEDKTDDEGTVSNKTSVESLKETNENNSNSAGFSQTRDLKMRDILWEDPLKYPA